jgi:hypothetical protein
MFGEFGFSDEQAKARGRMMVVYMMGESTLIPDSMSKPVDSVRLAPAILSDSASSIRD